MCGTSRSTNTIVSLFIIIILVLIPLSSHCFSISILLPSSMKSKSFNKRASSLTLQEQKENDNSVNISTSCGNEEMLPFDPKYATHGTIGRGTFIITREGEPTKAELTNENLLKIVQCETNDLEVNTLVWRCLGYRFDIDTKSWSNEKCFPKWKEKHPTPPDLIGMQRIYTKEIDRPSLKSNQDLIRSIPVDWKQSLKKQLKPLGFSGYKLAELTPNKTRRAQCTNWLLYYREELFGYSIEQLRERRRVRLQRQEEERERREAEGKQEDEWKPPVKEVF